MENEKRTYAEGMDFMANFNSFITISIAVINDVMCCIPDVPYIYNYTLITLV